MRDRLTERDDCMRLALLAMAGGLALSIAWILFGLSMVRV